MEYTQELLLDMNPNVAPIVIGAKQRDRDTRKLLIQCIQNGKKYPIDASHSAGVRICLPDKSFVFLEGQISANYGTTTVILTDKALAQAGTAYADFIEFDTMGNTLSTVPFIINIMRSPETVADDGPNSLDYLQHFLTTSITSGEAIISGDTLYLSDVSAAEAVPSYPSVTMVNGKYGIVHLNAADVYALPADTEIPTAISSLVNDTEYITKYESLGKLNYINTLTPITKSNSLNSETMRQNATRINDDTAIRLGYLYEEDIYFSINLIERLQPIEEGYVLSFDCSSLGTAAPVFEIYTGSGESKLTIAQSYALHQGRNKIHFVLDGVSGKQITFFQEYNANTCPRNADIILENFQIEVGNKGTDYYPSLLAVQAELQEDKQLTHIYTNEDDWTTMVIGDKFVVGSLVRGIGKIRVGTKGAFSAASDSDNIINSYNPNTVYSEHIYVPLPMPMRYVNLTGTCDRTGAYVANVNGIGSDDGADAAVGASMRIFFNLDASPSIITRDNVYMRLMTMGMRHSVPTSPRASWDSTIANDIVRVAKTYIYSMSSAAAVPSGSGIGEDRVYSYGDNITYGESRVRPYNGLLTNSAGEIKMECDVFAGMVLRGLDYENSPYAVTPKSCYDDYIYGGLTFEDYSTNSQFNGISIKKKPDVFDLNALNALPSESNSIGDIRRVIYNEELSPSVSDFDDSTPETSRPVPLSADYVYLGENWEPYRAWVGTASTDDLSNRRIIARSWKDNNKEQLKTGYEKFMEIINTNASSLGSADTTWARNLRQLIQDTVAVKCFGREIKYACDYAWMFWRVKGSIFSDSSQARPGDVAFWRGTETGSWFDNISHIAIVGEREGEYLTVYEISGLVETGHKTLAHTSLKYRSAQPAYFARPYGWIGYNNNPNET